MATKAQPENEVRKVRVRLFKDADKYADDVFVGWNGKGYRIKRGVPVEVPEPVAEILEQSQEQDSKTAAYIEREVNSFRAAEAANML